ncbi:MAG: squalene/phytoene synthase family protein [Gemmatimonadetes bacterium]|nr:squalene/phytoene synthase family protein [Gemmatimonadota bacterium]
MTVALDGLTQARSHVRRALDAASAKLASDGLPRPALDGKLLRPLAAYIMVPPDRRNELDERFWMGALAIEMVHEASLLHDDIIDEAPERRGKPTMAAVFGVGPALVMGDHLLTAAYRTAAATRSPEFLTVFIRSVERTVAGEIEQEKSQNRILDEEEYYRIISAKSGDLFRSAFTLAPALLGIGSPDVSGELGARFGTLYQMVDDFLDYCTEADRGKAPLQDYRQKKWTWPLGLVRATDFFLPTDEILSLLFQRPSPGGKSPMEWGADRLEGDFESLIKRLSEEGLETGEIQTLLRSWTQLVQNAALAQEEAGEARELPDSGPLSPDVGGSTVEWPRTAVLRRELRIAAEGLETAKGRLAYFGKHAKSFRFASRLFPQEQLRRVAGVYAFCRFTDDLVDEAADQRFEMVEPRLNAWLSMAKQAYKGEKTGIPLLDDVIGDMAQADVPFSYVEELVAGVRMDLMDPRFQTLSDLRVYSFRVASVVGGWLTELFGIRDPWVLDRAYALGHAMQLTNILRDVGEDLGMGRLYLPEELMSTHGVDRKFLEAKVQNGSPASPGYRRLLERLMEEAEIDYERAFEAIPALPTFFRGPVAVAANVYRGIHREIRENGYDNLTRRASTSMPRKILLGVGGLLKLRRASAYQKRKRDEQYLPVTAFGEEEGRQAAQ